VRRLFRSVLVPVTSLVLSPALMISLLAAPTATQLQVSERLVGPALTEGHAWARLAELSDGVGPRLAGSEGAEAAVQWWRSPRWRS
jgi:hypothetical protein